MPVGQFLNGELSVTIIAPSPLSGQPPPRRRRKRTQADFYRALEIAHLPHVANEILDVNVSLDAYEWTREEVSKILGQWKKLHSVLCQRVVDDLETGFASERLDRYVDARVRQLRGRRRGRPPGKSACKKTDGSGNVCLFKIPDNEAVERGSPNGIAPGNAAQNGDEAGWHAICSSDTVISNLVGQSINHSNYDWLSTPIDTRKHNIRNSFVFADRFVDPVWLEKTLWLAGQGIMLWCCASPISYPFSPYETWHATSRNAVWFHSFLLADGVEYGVSRCDVCIDLDGSNEQSSVHAVEFLNSLVNQGLLEYQEFVDEKTQKKTQYFFDEKKRVLLRIYPRAGERVELQIRPPSRDRKRFAGVQPDAVWSFRWWTAHVFELLTGEPPPPLPPRQKPLDEFARATCPPDKPFVRVPVVGSSGLFLRVGRRTRTWAANRNGTTITLGQYPAMSAAQAKQALRRYDRAQSRS